MRSLTYVTHGRQNHGLQAAARRTRRQWLRHKHHRRNKRMLVQEIQELVPFALKAIIAESTDNDLRTYPYIRWSSRSLLGKIWRVGRITQVQRWDIPRVVASEAMRHGSGRRFCLTSNGRVIQPTEGKLYRRNRATKIASIEELQSIKAGLRQITGDYAGRLARHP